MWIFRAYEFEPCLRSIGSSIVGAKSKAELIGMILERFAEEPFDAFVEDGQDAIVLRKIDKLDFTEMEEAFVDELLMTKVELEMAEGEKVDIEDFKVGWSDWETKCLLQRINRKQIKSDVLDKLLDKMGLVGLGYAEVITRLYRSFVLGKIPLAKNW